MSAASPNAALGQGLMTRVQQIHAQLDRRGRAAVPEPEAPTILHIAVDPQDLADVIADRAAPGVLIDVAAAARAAGQHADDPVVPSSPLEVELLEAARSCAAGDTRQPPRRELVAVGLREVRREQVRVDQLLDRLIASQAREAELRETQRGLLAIQGELVRWLGHALGIRDASVRVVLERVRTLLRGELADGERSSDTAPLCGCGEPTCRGGCPSEPDADARPHPRRAARSITRPARRGDASVAARAWNAQHPVGSAVVVQLDSGAEHRGTTRSEAMVSHSGDAVIHVTGIRGYYLLSRVSPDRARTSADATGAS